MRSRHFRFIADTRGATLLEFALTAPVLAAILFGLFEVSRLYFTQSLLIDGVQNAARTAVLEQTGDGTRLRGVVETALASVGTSRLEAVDITGPTTLPDSMRIITVSARYRFESATPFLPLGTIELNAQASGYLAPL